MERNDFAGLIVYIIMLVLAFVVGQTVISIGSAEVSAVITISYPAYVIICLVASFLAYTVLYELGHIIGAKIGKYNLISINFCGFCFSKIDNKWKFSFKSPEGLISETRFVPKKENCNPKFFLWGGVVAYLLSVIVGLSLFFIPNLPATIKHGSLIYIAIGMIILFYNVVPIPLDTLNDGYRIKLIGNKANAEAYNEFMRIENDIRNGLEPKDVKVYDSVSPITVMVNMYRFYELMDQNKTEEAEKIIEMMLEKGNLLDAPTLIRLKAQHLWYIIMTKPLEEASKYYWKTMTSKDRKDIAGDKNYISRRAYLLLSGVINNSLSEARIALSNYKTVKKISDIRRRRVEIKLYRESMDMVKALIPEADFSDLL